MKNEEVVSLLKRVAKAWDLKAQWLSLYDDAYSLAIPNRNTLVSQTPGAVKNVVVYDSTLQQCTAELASTLQSTIVPPFTEWAMLTPGPFITQNLDEVRAKLANINKAIFAAIGISDFDTAVGEYFLDLCIGTAAMLILEGSDDNPLKFITVPLSEIALEEGPDSKIGAIYRRYKKPARTIPQMWKDGIKFPELEKLINEDGGKEVVLDEITYYDPETGKWKYLIIIDKLQYAIGPTVYVERTYRTNPWVVSRWMKVSGETFGRGPVINALPDAKTLNEAKKLELQNASLAVAGVWLARNNGVLNQNSIRIRPGSVISVQSTGGSIGADIAPLSVGGDINFSQIVQEQLRQSIKDAMFNQSIPEQGAVRSATEWIVRQQKLQEAIGAPFGRLYREFIIPLYSRVLDILKKKGIIENIIVNGGAVKVQITASLAQAQNLKEVETILNWAQTTLSITGPEILQTSVKVENIPQVLGNLMGVSPELFRSNEEKQQLLQIAQQAMSQQAVQQPEGK